MTADPASPEPGYDSENFRKYRPRNRLYRKHLDLFHAALLDMVDRSGARSVLEVGCGEGFVLQVLRDHARDSGRTLDLSGLDVRPGAVAYAARQLDGAARLTTGSCYHLPFPDRHFDTVICSQVLEHLVDPDRALAEILRVARNTVVVTVPREPLFRTIAALFTLLGIGATPGHVNFWGRRSFHDLLQRHLSGVETVTSTVYRLGMGGVAGAGSGRETGEEPRDRSAAA